MVGGYRSCYGAVLMDGDDVLLLVFVESLDRESIQSACRGSGHRCDILLYIDIVVYPQVRRRVRCLDLPSRRSNEHSRRNRLTGTTLLVFFLVVLFVR